MTKFTTNLYLISIVTIFLVFFSSCSQTYTEKVFNYRIQCENCKQTTDGLLSFEFNNYISIDSIPYIKIINISDKYIILDERYFVLSDNDMVVLNPVGLYDPNINYSFSSTQGSTVSATDNLLNNYFKNPYTNIDYLSKSASQSYSSSQSTVQQPLLMLPPKTNCNYFIMDYLFYKYLDIKKRNSSKVPGQNYIIFKWGEIKNSIKELNTRKLTLTLVYKEINEKDWRYYNINYYPIDIKIDEIERKK